MPTNNFLFYFSQIIFGLVKDFVFLPVWWYSRGLFELVGKIGDFWLDSLKGLNLVVWIKNIFVPMYGQRDFAGVLISVFMRIIQIIFRGIGFIFLLVFGLAVILIWLALPILILWQIVFQLS